jgi:hypothetical protein
MLKRPRDRERNGVIDELAERALKERRERMTIERCEKF